MVSRGTSPSLGLVLETSACLGMWARPEASLSHGVCICSWLDLSTGQAGPQGQVCDLNPGEEVQFSTWEGGDGGGWGGGVVVDDRTGKTGQGQGQEQAVRELASGRGRRQGEVWRGRAEGMMVDGGESREEGKVPRVEMRDGRNGKTWRTEGRLGKSPGLRYMRQERRPEKVEEYWGQWVR